MSWITTALLWGLFVAATLVQIRLPLVHLSANNLVAPLFAVSLAWRERHTAAAALRREGRGATWADNATQPVFLLALGFVLLLLTFPVPTAQLGLRHAPGLPLLGLGQIVDCFTYEYTFIVFGLFFTACYASVPREAG